MKEKMELFLGPCVLESEELAFQIAETLVHDLKPYEDSIVLHFKGSFDKANRTSIKSFRGQGIEKGLKILENVKNKFNLPVITDFHGPGQADEVASVVDVLQVPAFLCRQTDMIIAGSKACVKYKRRLKIKKGQFLAPAETGNIVLKANEYLDKESIILTERGTCFGYNNLVVDMASFQIMKSFGVKAVFDATHSVQQPGGLGTSSGGKREQVFSLARAAVAAGADGLFIETHPDPENALSDPATSLPLAQIKGIVEKILNIYKAV